jgi:hypothetical protein
MSFARRRAARLAALGAAAVAALAASAGPAAAAPPIPAGGATITHASLDWTGDPAMQAQNFGQAHFFSAGVSKGTEATYKGAEGNAEVLLEAEGDEVATWATHLNYSKEAGHNQVVRLSGGTGHVEADGSGQIEWDATFTVDYYGTLAPWTVEDPKLTVDADGTGELTANLIGCTASRTGGECTPFAPVANAQIATFKGASISSLGELTIDPDYEGVEVDTTGAAAQNRTVAGWGAWPQDMVSFQIQTGLSSFFYSSGSSADAEKVPLPFTVNLNGPIHFDGASLDWSGNDVMQSPMFGFYNYFSAGVSGGTEATYAGSAGNASVLLEREAGATATWATHQNYAAPAGERQVVDLTNGVGEVEADGAAKVEWDGAWSVNFYSGMVPFTIEDPRLVVGADGTGELLATLQGCASSQAEPGVCTTLPAASDVQVATFHDAHVNRAGELTVTPDYAGVEVDTGASTPQNRTEAGWGSWPQSFVDFQLQNGLSSYWYSSGSGEDAKKVPLPFGVALGVEVDLEEAAEEGTGGGGEVTPPVEEGTDDKAGSDDKSGSDDAATTTAPPAIHKPAKVSAGKATRMLGGGGVAKVATLSCPAGGTACKVTVPARVATKIGGKRFVLSVIAPQKIGAGKSAAVKVRLPKAAREALGARKLALKLPIALYANGQVTKKVVKVAIAGKR